MKNNSGISLISLLVTIIVIIILAIVTVMTGIGSIKETSKTKVNVEIAKIKEAVHERMIDNNRNEAKYPLIGEKVDDITGYFAYIEGISNNEIHALMKKVDSENKDYYRIIDASQAAMLGVENVDTGHHFIVNYLTGDVYGNVNLNGF